jgi:hypothetical protein
MGEVVQTTQQEFWRPPTVEAINASAVEPLLPLTATSCPRCGAEFMIGSRFCHSCGSLRRNRKFPDQTGTAALGFFEQKLVWLRIAKDHLSQHGFYVPSWLRYLHFHEIKRWIGLPTAAFIAFMAGLGCVAGAIGIGLFYKASNLAEFQAVQLWRIEWLLAATASFVAGILLKRPADDE